METKLDSKWGEDKIMAVVLTIDPDAETSWMARDPDIISKPVQRSIGRFGPKTGLPPLLELLDRYELKATFFTPSWVIENYKPIMEEVVKRGHEIGAHGYTHDRPDKLTPEKEEETLAKSIEIISGLTGNKPLGYRAPGWEYSDITVALLYKYQFSYASDMMDDYMPYFHMNPSTGKPGNLVQLPVDWMLDDYTFFDFSHITQQRTPYPVDDVLKIWTDEFEARYKRGGLFLLAVHPQRIGKPSRIDMFERLLIHMANYPKVWFAKCSEVASYWRERYEPKG